MLSVINKRIQISTFVCKFQETFPGELAINANIQAKSPRLDHHIRRGQRNVSGDKKEL